MAITLNGTTGITTPDVDSTDLTATGNFTSRGIDDNATSTAMTLDSSGNLLVGTTQTFPAFNNVVGCEVGGFGQISASRDGAEAMQLNRKTSDGDIALFKKDGTTVGSIGIQSGGLTIDGEAGHSGLRFGGADISPRDGGADADNAIQLGSTVNRFTDLYLSGGVFLGGTGAANKLDDYEEGTWTPLDESGAGLTFSSVVGPTYTKIGRIVIVNVELTFPTTSNTNRVAVGGFPFNIASPSAHGGFIRYSNQSDRPHILANPSTTKMVLYSQAGGLFSNNQLSAKRFDFTVIYHTTD